VDQFGSISQIRSQTIQPSELTGWVVTHSNLPVTDATTASSAEGLPETLTKPADIIPATSPSTTISRHVYSIKCLKDLGSTAIVSAPLSITLGPKVHSIGCLKGKVVNNSVSKPCAVEEVFEIVSKAEIDNEFDVLDGEGPSAANGAIKSAFKDAIKDANAAILSLDSAFRSAWAA
jgi:hypothetical protein